MSLLKKVISRQEEASTRWYVRVPLVTNPLVFTDMLTLAAVIVAVVFLLVPAVQFVTGGGIGSAQIAAALRLAIYVGFVFFLAFAGVSLFVLRNGYTAYYELTDKGLFSEIIRDDFRGGLREIFCCRAFAVPPPERIRRSRSKSIELKEIIKVKKIESLGVIIVKSRSEMIKMYTPDQQHYALALAQLEKAAGGNGK